MFNIGRMLQVGTVRIGEFDGPDPDRGPPFKRRGPELYRRMAEINHRRSGKESRETWPALN